MHHTPKRVVLVMEDDPDDLEQLQEVFHALPGDYELVTAANGEEGISLLQEIRASGKQPCLIILDINMPKMDGKQTLLALQKDLHFTALPVVVFSTSSNPLDRIFFDQKGVPYFTKPVNYRHFTEVVDRMLAYCKDE